MYNWKKFQELNFGYIIRSIQKSIIPGRCCCFQRHLEWQKWQIKRLTLVSNVRIADSLFRIHLETVKLKNPQASIHKLSNIKCGLVLYSLIVGHFLTSNDAQLQILRLGSLGKRSNKPLINDVVQLGHKKQVFFFFKACTKLPFHFLKQNYEVHINWSWSCSSQTKQSNKNSKQEKECNVLPLLTQRF